MSSSDAESIRKQTRTYVGVFIALAIGTVLTVAVSYLHMPVVLAIAVALIIASFKGSLVAAFFMHLAHERRVIYWVLILTVSFFIALMLIPSLTEWNQRYIP